MGRLWQVFSGPVALDELPDDGYDSPWSYPAQVRIPMEHWDAIIAFARTRDEDGAALLEHASILDGSALDAASEARFVLLLERLAKEVVGAPPLTPENSDPVDIPEPMPNTVHAVMLRDILRLIRRTRQVGAVIDSWVD